jgi:hypothetical protein
MLLILWLRPEMGATVLERALPCETEYEPLPHDRDQTVSGNPEQCRYLVHHHAVLHAAVQCGDLTNHWLVEGGCR